VPSDTVCAKININNFLDKYEKRVDNKRSEDKP
jgi:hypothetical protein